MVPPDASYDVIVTRETAWVRVRVVGTPTIDQLLSAVHLLGVRSEAWPQRAMLVDLRDVSTPFEPVEQYRLGEETAASLSHMARIASVVPAERVTRISQKAARRSGTNVMVFDNEAEAVAWLTGADPSSLPAGLDGSESTAS